MTESLEERFQNLHEFITQARTNLNRNNWDYLIGGSETETTLPRNRAALDAYGFRPRVLRDVSNVDCSRIFFGKKLPTRCFAGRLGARGVRAGWRRHRHRGHPRVRQRDDLEFRSASCRLRRTGKAYFIRRSGG